MELIRNEDAPRFKNSPGCIATEYNFKNENNFNIASIDLDGRYPEQGYALNTISRELIYVKKGDGILVAGNKNVAINPGDTALIKPNEKYYLEGTMELIISSSPAWHPGQYQNILN
jgi:mannose-6-phosphate isomerase class I